MMFTEYLNGVAEVVGSNPTVYLSLVKSNIFLSGVARESTAYPAPIKGQ
jgi:hypothetical protein